MTLPSALPSRRPLAQSRSAMVAHAWNVRPAMLWELLPAVLATLVAAAGWSTMSRGAVLGVCAAAMWVVAIRAPAAAFAVIFAAAPWYYDVGNGEVQVTLADILLVAVVPVFLFRRLRSAQPLVLDPIVIAIGGYVAACGLTTVANSITPVAVQNLVQMLLYVVVVVAVFGYGILRPDELDLAYWSYVVSVTFIACAVLGTGEMFVLGLHKNAVGGVLSIGVVIATHLLLHSRERGHSVLLPSLLLFLISAALVISASRGAWVGAIVGVAAILVVYKKRMLAMRLSVALAIVAGIGWVLMPEERREYATNLDRGAWNIKLRYESADYAWQLFQQSPLLGHGLQLRDGYDATNLVLLTLAESGVLGFVALTFMLFTFGRCAIVMSRRIPVGTSHFSLLAIGIGLIVCKAGHGMFDHYWGRGLTVPWAGVGMLLAAWGILSRRAGPHRGLVSTL